MNVSAATTTLTRPVPLRKVITILLILAVIAFAVFFYMYQFPEEPAFTIAPGTIPAPRFEKMLYGGFGEDAMQKPMDVTVFNDRVYVSDAMAREINVMDMDGELLFKFGEFGESPGQFHYPYGIDHDSDGNIYVADLHQNRLSVFNADGDFLKFFANDGTIVGPAALRIFEGKLYVSSIGANKIFVFDIVTEQLLAEIKDDQWPLYSPNGFTLDLEGNIYIVDTGNAMVRIYSPEGELLNYFGNEALLNPRGITVDRHNRILVVSNMGHNFYVYSPEGEMLHNIGTVGEGLQNFTLPNGLYQDETGRFYITDTANGRVAVYR
ncbi:MAG: 6-bladed beta-propeller [Bacillota bacterium]|nr:6-bladed beta-propeller [Bacillota bacterium]